MIQYFLNNRMDMETRIRKTLCHWFPDAFVDKEESLFGSDYAILRQFAEYTMKLMSDKCENNRDPFRIIHLLYSKGTLFEKNAIENEFFNVLASGENAMSLKEHLELMPDEIKEVYIRTILDN
jgi:hypothetical protein